MEIRAPDEAKKIMLVGLSCLFWGGKDWNGK